MRRAAVMALGATGCLLFQAGCATRPPLLPDETSAVSASCNWNGEIGALTKPGPIQGACDYDRAALKGRYWYVYGKVPPCSGVCLGGFGYVVIDKRTGRVVREMAGE